MFTQLFAIVLVNTFSWTAGQGICAYDFALNEPDSEYTGLHIVLRPEYKAAKLESGVSKLDDVAIDIDDIGGGRFNWGKTAKVETDCGISGLTVVSAKAKEDGKAVDLVKLKRIQFDKYNPVTLKIRK